MRNGFLALIGALTFSLTAFAEPAQPPASGANDSDKLDIKKLEDKYWAAKDDDFSVVQNRAFTKAGRYYLNLSSGYPINDPYSSGNVSNVSVGYFWNERWGAEVSLLNATFRDNDATEQFVKDHGTVPNHNVLSKTQSVILNYVPLYAKMSLLDRKIIYFDMGIGVGLGTTEAESQVITGNTSQSVSHYLVDVHQQYFFSEHFAFTIKYRNVFSVEERFRYKMNPGEPESARSLGNKSINDTLLLFGLTYWL